MYLIQWMNTIVHLPIKYNIVIEIAINVEKKGDYLPHWDSEC